MGKAALLPAAVLLSAFQGCSSIPPISPGWLIPVAIFALGAGAKWLMWMAKTDATLGTVVAALDRSSKAQEKAALALEKLVLHEASLEELEDDVEDHEERIRALEKALRRSLE